MTRNVQIGNRFKRDARLMARRGKKLDKLWGIVDRLRRDLPLEPRHRQHRLSGEFAGFWECHIEADWLLIWDIDDAAVYLARTSTHADLFE